MTPRLVICLLLILPWCSTVYSDDMVGRASIIDADTLEIHGVRTEQLAASNTVKD
jgi:hypothetical protein